MFPRPINEAKLFLPTIPPSLLILDIPLTGFYLPWHHLPSKCDVFLLMIGLQKPRIDGNCLLIAFDELVLSFHIHTDLTSHDDWIGNVCFSPGGYMHYLFLNCDRMRM